MHKRLAIDFDGTLFDDSGNINNFIDLTPKKDAAKITKKLKENGYELLIYTCRPDYHRKYLENQLNKHKIKFDYILFYTKPRVDLYIDDKALKFESWNQVYEDIKWAELNNLKLQQPFSTFEKILQKEKIKPILNYKNKSILDIGCGDGSTFANSDFKYVTGYDINTSALNLCSKVKNYIFLTDKLKDIDIKKFDLITMLGVIEHLDDIEIKKIFSIILKYKIPVYITVPNASSFHRHFGVEMNLIKNIYELSENDFKIGHKTYYDINKFSNLIKSFFNQSNYKLEFGSLAFKIFSNKKMENFQNIKEFFTTTEKLNLTGKSNFLGAELYCFIKPL